MATPHCCQARSWIRAHAAELGLAGPGTAAFLNGTDLHIHFPAGAIPKDGPSAGVTITTAIVSLLTGRRVRPHLAMTGEVTLRGLVLPVGGIREKVIAAHRGGMRTVILPAKNEKDLTDLPPAVLAEMNFTLVREIDEVLDAALLPAGDDSAASTAGGDGGDGGDGDGDGSARPARSPLVDGADTPPMPMPVPTAAAGVRAPRRLVVAAAASGATARRAVATTPLRAARERD